jgi:menaquinone-dependent protoporphyrinogen oxidase
MTTPQQMTPERSVRGPGRALRILVAYATAGSEGQTAQIAGRLAEVLRDEGASVDVVDCEARPGIAVEGYDGALLGGSVRGGRYRRSLRRLLRRQREVLARRPWGFYSVCLTVASQREKDRIRARELPWRLMRKEGLAPRRVAVFAGALRFSHHGRLGARILFAVNRRYLGRDDMSRDWVYTDWDEVAAFAHGFLASVIDARAGWEP